MRSLLVVLTVLTSYASIGQSADTARVSTYDPHALFAPMSYPSSTNESRAATGEPGTGYWQNRADYQMNVTLDTVANTITGTVTISYKNNSPLPLGFLWLQLDQNLF